MRRARYKSSESAFYHIFTRLAGPAGYFPLQQPIACQRLLETIRTYVRAYSCQLVAYAILGNHYHLILFMPSYRRLTRLELQKRARLLYGNRAELKTAAWSPAAWHQFNRKLFDLSSLMQHINGEYAKWFNRRFHRRGHLWADRYQNPLLLDPRALQECLFYVESNPLRAGLVQRPEQWKAGSAWLRWRGLDQELTPLKEIFPEVSLKEVFPHYRLQLAQRAGLLEPEASSLASPVCFRQRLPFFTQGLALGSCSNVRIRLDQLRSQGSYQRRKHPVPQLSGFLYSLREQRSRAPH